MKLTKVLLCVASVAVCATVAAFAGEETTVTASTVISAMGTGLTAAQGNIFSMLNTVVPVGVGVFGTTQALRIGKKAFKIVGGSGN